MNKITLLGALLVAFAFTGSAQAQTMSPTQAYLTYHKAVIAASKMDDIIGYSTAVNAAGMRGGPAERQKALLEFLKAFVGDEKGLTVGSEKINGSEATLKVAYCFEGKRGTSNVTMVLEGASWKVGDATTKHGLGPCK